MRTAVRVICPLCDDVFQSSYENISMIHTEKQVCAKCKKAWLILRGKLLEEAECHIKEGK